MSRVQEK